MEENEESSEEYADLPESGLSLNEKQKRFCQLYVSSEFFAHGTDAYIEAYRIPLVGNYYRSAAASASRLLKNVNVCSYINKLLQEEGLNDAYVDKQMLFLITQHADFAAKLGAIKEYNKLKQRITEKVEHSGEMGIKQFNVHPASKKKG